MSQFFHQEAEQSLLGALLVRNEVYSKIIDIVRAEHFYHPAHQVIFSEIANRLNQGTTVDHHILKSLENNPHVAELGGRAYIGELSNNVISTYAAPDYARAIRQEFIKRRIHEVSDSFYGKLQENPDAESVLSEMERELFSIRESDVEERILSIDDGVKEVIEWISAVQSGQMTPIKSGLWAVDNIISGFYPGRLYIIAGRPGMGKSVLGMNIAENAARSKKALFFSLEMSRKELSMRLLAKHNNISVQRQFEGSVNPLEIARLRDGYKQPNLLVSDNASMSIYQIGQYAKRVKKAQGLDIIIIDYLGLIKGDNKLPIVQRIAEITAEAKRMSKELGVAVVMLAQLNRGVEDRDNKRPMLSDLRDSGAIEQDADVVLLLYREEYYSENEQQTERRGRKRDDKPYVDPTGKAEIIIAKNRQGETKTAHVGFNGAGQFFYDMGQQ